MTEHRRLYQQIGEQLREQIFQQKYTVGNKLPSEKAICEEFSVSRTVVREAVIMLELEGLVEVRKGSGIHVISSTPKTSVGSDGELDQFVRYVVSELKKAGPFEMLQARQLVECMIAAFSATQVTKQDIQQLQEIQKSGQVEDVARDSEWDKKFHIQVAKATKNSVLSLLVELMWFGRKNNPLWQQLHGHIESEDLNNWNQEHSEILSSLLRKNPKETQQAMWQHIESTRQVLFSASSTDEEPYDKYLFQDNPLKALD